MRGFYFRHHTFFGDKKKHSPGYQQIVGSVATNNTIGIANSTVVDTETVNVDILAGINASQTGLTIGDTYYVDSDGTITNIDSGLGVIGKALSATELLITKGV